jgi:NOL1/NOP2/fmu family ribosome biogenesis protein
MNHAFVKSAEKKQILKELNETFGIEELPYLFIESGKEKIRAFSGSLSKEEILGIARLTRVEGVGIYFLKKEITGIRMSFEAVQLLKNQITKNILDLTDEQANSWIKGNDLAVKTPTGVYVMRNNGLLLGCGKSNGEVIFNYVPKERRLKK